MVELMVQNSSKFISKLFLCLVFHEIKLKLVSSCFFCLNLTLYQRKIEFDQGMKKIYFIKKKLSYFFETLSCIKSSDENMKKPASQVAKPAQIQPKSQFLFLTSVMICKFLQPCYFC